MSNQNWFDSLTPEDLPGDLQTLAAKCGIEVALKVSELFGGGRPYIPQVTTLVSEAKRRFIHENKQRTISQLSRATGYSERQVQRILQGDGGDDRQADMFGGSP